MRAVAQGTSPQEGLVIDVMTAEPYTVSIDASVQDVQRVMSEHKVRRVLVVDDRGRCLGVVAPADRARGGGSDEEVSEVLEQISTPGEELRPTL